MSPFSIDDFAATCKRAMATASDPQTAAAELLATAIATHGPEAIIEALEAAVPLGADIGELVVHASPELTMLFARGPAHFQSGIHNHTVFACVGQLRGEEKNTIYASDGDILRPVREQTGHLGTVVQLPADAIRAIANPGDETACSLHVYGGDLPGIAERRSLWDEHTREEKAFSFPALLKESVAAMRRSDNEAGLQAIMEAMPAARGLVEAV